MKRTIAATVGGMLAAGVATTAWADHNSRWGEGTAFDPFGVHSARIDSLDKGSSNSGFRGRDYVTPGQVTPRRSPPSTVSTGYARSAGGRGRR